MIQDPIFWLLLFGSAAVFWLLPNSYRRPFLAVLSLGVIAYYDLLSSAFLVGLSIFLYVCMIPLKRGDGYSLAALIITVAVLLAPLVAFKSFAAVLLDPGRPVATAGDILVPLGMSYYVFRLVHVAMDAYRRQSFDYSLKDYFCWVFLFTIAVAGPIQRLDLFVRNASERFESAHVLHGLTRIAYGLIKQTVIIDLLVGLRDWSLSEPPGLLSLAALGQFSYGELWMVVVIAYLTAYLNLGAYTDIAIGASRLFGFVISENFRLPIVARTATDFWRRWHITLSSWCQDYVYAPVLGLSRNPYLALFFSFQVMGLWHMFTLNRVAWGMFHAAGVAGVFLWDRLSRRKGFALENSFWGKCAAWFLTQAFVSASFVFVVAERSNDVLGSLRILLRLLTGL